MISARELFQEKSPDRWMALLGIVLFFAIAAISSWMRSFNHDEFEAIHSAWKVFSGEKIYVDFLQHHHFLLYYSLGPVFYFFGASIQSIMASRVLMFILSVGIVWLTCKIAALVYGRKTALLSGFFLSTLVIFVQKAIEVRPDVPLVFFCLASIFFLLKYFQEKSLRYLMGSATFLFLAFLFLQKAVFLAILFGLIFIYKLYKKETSYRDFFLYWGTFGIYLGFFALYVAKTFTLSEYIFLNWIINTKLLNTFPLYKYLLISAYQNPLFWILFTAGAALMIKRRSFDIVGFLALGLLSFIFTTKSPFPQYYLLSAPLIAIVAAAQAANFLEKRPKFGAVLMFLSLAGSCFFIWDAWKDNSRQLAKIDYVLSATTPDDYVYDGDANFNIFRKDISYFWFSVKPKTGVLESYRLFREYDYDVYRLIDELKPKVVSDSFVKVKDGAIADNYSRSEAYRELYIRK